MTKKITIAWIYPQLMNIYGDYGNVLTLRRRLEWRGIEVKILEIDFDNSKEIEKADILLLGGGQDRQQTLCALDLLTKKKKHLEEAYGKGISGLFVCGGYQLLGHFYHPLGKLEISNFDPVRFKEKMASFKFVPGEGADVPGIGIFPQYTVHHGEMRPRCIGNVVSELTREMVTEMEKFSELKIKMVVGFENHGGRTYAFEKIEPLGKVVKGFGNNGEDRQEGIVAKNFIGSYLHGLLIKNPHVADFLIYQALKRKYEIEKLEELDDTLEWKAHKKIFN